MGPAAVEGAIGLALVGLVVYGIFRLMVNADRPVLRQPPGTVAMPEGRARNLEALVEDVYGLLGDLEEPSEPEDALVWSRRVDAVRARLSALRMDSPPAAGRRHRTRSRT